MFRKLQFRVSMRGFCLPRKANTMANKYYWLKLKNDFFKRHDIRVIESMDNGEKYVLFYMKLLLESITHDGELRFSDIIPYDEKTLSIITNTDVDVVRSAMKLLTELGMVQILDDSTIFMSECQKMIGNDNTAERVRKSREKKKLALLEEECNVTVTLPSISISNSNSLSNSISNKYPTVEEVREYCKERNNSVDADTFVDFYSAKGWLIGKNKMKDWKAAVRTWEKNESQKKTQTEELWEKMGDKK